MFSQRIIVIFTVLFLISLAFSASQVYSQEQPVTAKAAIQKAKKMVTKWSADAQLFEIHCPNIADDGGLKKGDVTSQWNLIYYSPKAKKVLTVVIVIPSGPEVKEISSFESTETFTQAIPADFIDSKQAIEEAKKNGFKHEGSTNVHLVYTTVKAINKAIFAWSILDDIDPTLTKYYTDALTGKFIGKE
jgi:hypothetical protein